jgi:transposase
MISSITNRERLGFMIFRKRFTARVFLNFLARLVRLTRKNGRNLFLIVDGHPVHKSRSVSRWLAEHAAQIRIFCLPSYSPELNPNTHLQFRQCQSSLKRRIALHWEQEGGRAISSNMVGQPSVYARFPFHKRT